MPQLVPVRKSENPDSIGQSPVGGFGSAPELHHIEIPLSYYWLLIRRYRWRIATLVLLVTSAATMYALSLKKVYDASTILRVDPSGLHVVGQDQNQTGGGDPRLLMATEADVIKSPAVVLEAINTLHLGDISEFQAAAPSGGPLSSAAQTDRLLRDVTGHITVSQPLDTYLLEIHFRSIDPELAASAANGLANDFLEHEYTTRARALTDSTQYMASQVDTLRAQMERDQTALVTYESKNDVIDPDDKTNIYQARLSQINSDLSRAESARMTLQADDQSLETARASLKAGDSSLSDGDIDALLASPRGQALVPLRDRYLNDQRQLVQLGAIYGDAHPLYRQQAALVASDKAVLNEEMDHIGAQIHDQYLAAVDNESLIRASLDEEKKAFDDFNLRAVNFRALKAAADSSTALFYDLQKEIQDSTVAAGQRSENLRIISQARPSVIAVSPRVTLWFLTSLLISSILGIGGAIMVGVLDKSVSNPEQIERWFHIPVLASLPQVEVRAGPDAMSPANFFLAAPALQEDPGSGSAPSQKSAAVRHSAFQEAVLALHSAVSFAAGGELNALAVTSAAPAEGKSTVVANLAAAYAALGRRVVLVDADMRKPTAHRNFGVPNRKGLSSLLRNRSVLVDVLMPLAPNLTLLPAGPQVNNPAELLHNGFDAILEQLRTQFDLVLVDCPPALGFADAASVAPLVGGVVLVVRAGATERGNMNAALRQLTSVGSNVVGVILNRVSTEIGHYYGYYNHYGYKYYSRTEPEPDEE